MITQEIVCTTCQGYNTIKTKTAKIRMRIRKECDHLFVKGTESEEYSTESCITCRIQKKYRRL